MKSTWAAFFLYFLTWTITLFGGCNRPGDITAEPDSQSIALPKIRVGVVGDRQLGEEIQNQWRSSMDAELELQIIEPSAFAEENFASIARVDVFVYPSRYKADLIDKKKLLPIPDHLLETDDFNQRELLRPYRDTLVKFEGNWIAVSLGEPRPAVFYRTDIFAGNNLRPPQTWQQYNVVAEQISKLRSASSTPEDQMLFRVLEMHEPNAWGKNFAIRAAPYLMAQGRFSTFFDIRSMAPYILSPPFEQALADLIAAQPNVEFVSPQDAYQSILLGKAAMVITWPSISWTVLDANSTQIAEPLPISVVALPTASQRYDYSRERWVESESGAFTVRYEGFEGMLASVNVDAEFSTTARLFVTWLASKPFSTRLRTLAPHFGATRASHLGNLSPWLGDDLPADTKTKYSDIVRDYSQAELRMTWLPIAGVDSYEAALNSALQRVINGESKIEGALSDVENAWQALTEERTVERQSRLYRAELGL